MNLSFETHLIPVSVKGLCFGSALVTFPFSHTYILIIFHRIHINILFISKRVSYFNAFAQNSLRTKHEIGA